MVTDRRQAIRTFMKAHGLKQSPWARAAKVRESTLRDYLSGRNATMTLETLGKLAAAADATISDIIGEKPREQRANRALIAVGNLQVMPSTGGGVEIADDPDGEPFYFRREWLERVVGKEPSTLRIMRLTGNSMEPTLRKGDIALIHLRGGNPATEPGVYCLWDGNGLVVKRLHMLPGLPPRLRILSDNHDLYPPDEVSADSVHVIGKVIWRGGRVE